MNNSKTPKIVVGVGLAAVYATVLVFALRGGNDNVVVQSAPSTAPAPMAAEPADALVSQDTLAPEVTPPAVAPVPNPQAVSNAVKPPEAVRPQVASEAAPRAPEVPSAADAPVGKDSQITADVRSKVEAVAPDGDIDVTTKDGVVELAGSVPSRDVFDKAWLAARNVSDVRDVDVSALTISN